MNPLLKAALALEAAHSRIEPTTGDRTASELVGKAAKLETCKERVTARSKQSEHASSSPLETGTSNEVDRKADFEPVNLLPSALHRKATSLSKAQHTLLLAKQQKLNDLNARESAESSLLADAMDATLILPGNPPAPPCVSLPLAYYSPALTASPKIPEVQNKIRSIGFSSHLAASYRRNASPSTQSAI